MLNVGFSELLLIAASALLLIRPKDYPTVIRAFAKIIREVRALVAGARRQMDAVMEGSGLSEFQSTTRTIVDLEGKPQTAYDVSDLQGKDE